MGKLARSDKVRRRLRRDEVQEVEVLMDQGTVGSGEGGDAVVFIDGGQGVLEVLFNALLEADGVQGRVELIARWEHDGRSSEELNTALISDSIFPESSLAKIQHFLWGATALDREDWACEDGITTTEALSQNGGLVGAFEGVHGTDRRFGIGQCFFRAFNFVESKRQTRVDDQKVVCCLGAIGHDQSVVVRVEASYTLLAPVDTWGTLKEIVLIADNPLFFVVRFRPSGISKDATCNHGVRCLVVVLALGVEDSDFVGVDLAGTRELGD